MMEGSKRNINIEFLRVIAMLMIIMGHAIGHTYLLESMQNRTLNYYLVSLLGVICNAATNVYVMISGYLLCEKRIKVTRVLTLWIQVAFYSMFLYVVAIIFRISTFSISELLKSLLPISGNQYWFARVYFGLYLLMPFLNIFAHAMTKKQYQVFLCTSTVLFSFWRSFLPFATTLNIEGGNSIIWFVVLYMFAAYYRLHGLPKWIDGKRCLALIPVGLLVFSFITKECLGVISSYIGMDGKGTSLFTEFTSFPMLFSAFFILATTLKIKLKIPGGGIRALLWFSNSTFSVYLIHENINVKRALWELIGINRFSDSEMIIIIIVLVAVLILLVCTVLDKLLFAQVDRMLGCKLEDRLKKAQNFIDQRLYE